MISVGLKTILLLQVMLMGMGSLTGIAKLEVYAWYAVIFNLVNFIVYMTFFPSGLSLILELMYCHDGRPRWNVKVSTYTPVKMQINSVVVWALSTSITYLLQIAGFILFGSFCPDHFRYDCKTPLKFKNPHRKTSFRNFELESPIFAQLRPNKQSSAMIIR